MLHGKFILTARLGREAVVNLTVSDSTTRIAAIVEDAVLVPEDEMAWTFDPAMAFAFSEAN